MTIATPVEAVVEFNAAWAAGEVDAAMGWVADDAVYALYISGELLPHGGETVGREHIGAALHQVRVDFDYLLYRPLHLYAKNEVVRFQVEFMYRHRLSGEILIPGRAGDHRGRRLPNFAISLSSSAVKG